MDAQQALQLQDALFLENDALTGLRQMAEIGCGLTG